MSINIPFPGHFCMLINTFQRQSPRHPARRTGFRRLRINNRQRRAIFPAFKGPHGAIQDIVDAFPKADA